MMMDLSELDYIEFGIMSAEEIVQQSMCECKSTRLNGPNSVYDERMGVLENHKKCVTCGNSNKICIGHFGHIILNTPVLHPLYYKNLINVLRCICYQCGRLLLKKDQFQIHQLFRFQGNARFLKILEYVESMNLCSHCETPQPKYVLNTTDRSIMMVLKLQQGESRKIQYHEKDIFQVLERMDTQDITYMGFNVAKFHPKNLVLTVLPVLPPVDRPYILSESVTCDDDLTIQYLEIIKANNNLKNYQSNDTKRAKYVQILKFRIKSLFDNSSGSSKHSNGRPLKGIKKRLTGKEGLIRNNLMGKRVDKSARTVISPDPTLKINQIGIPPEVASVLCYPVRVNDRNMSQIRQWFKEGKINFILRGEGQIRINAKYATIRQGTRLIPGDIVFHDDDGTVETIKTEKQLFHIREGDRILRNGKFIKTITYNSCKEVDLKVGDVVERKLVDGDILLLNRQPTLHRGSMISQEVVIRPGKTIRMNLAICSSFNSDFDGDEMNLHCPASPETEAELRLLSSIENHVMTAQASSCNLPIVQDSLLGAFLMTREQCPKLSKAAFFQIAYEMARDESFLPDIVSEVERYWLSYPASRGEYTGRMLFSLLLPSDFSLQSGAVVIRAGLLAEGAITKSLLGKSHNSLISIFYREYSPARAITFINQVQFLTNAFVLWHGFSVGLGDCATARQEIIHESTQKGILKARSVEVTTSDSDLREAYVVQALANARDTGMMIARRCMDEDNNFLATVTSGSKGDYFNISQITSLVGQQNLGGQRIHPALSNETRGLPHYPFHRQDYNDADWYESFGFISNSFIHGLNPKEFFFHAISGREGITDTAMKSVTFSTRILFHQNNQIVCMAIGELIDNLLASNASRVHRCAYVGTETLELLPSEIQIPTTDDDGNFSWAAVSHVTRHDPTDIMYHIRTRSGREVTFTDSKSLIVFDSDEWKFLEKPSRKLRLGDFLPVQSILHLPSLERKTSTHPSRARAGLSILLGTRCADPSRILRFSSADEVGIRPLSKEHHRQLVLMAGREAVSFTTTATGDEEIIRFRGQQQQHCQDIMSRHEDELLTLLCERSADLDSELFLLSYLHGKRKGRPCQGKEVVHSGSGGGSFPAVMQVDLETHSRQFREQLMFLLSCHGFVTIDIEENLSRISVVPLEENHRGIWNDMLMDPIVEIDKFCSSTTTVSSKVYDLTVPSTLNFGLANGLQIRDTATSGYIQRRMIKVAEDIQIRYDQTVRNSSNSILQFSYGESGYNPIETTIQKNKPSFIDIKRTVEKLHRALED